MDSVDQRHDCQTENRREIEHSPKRKHEFRDRLKVDEAVLKKRFQGIVSFANADTQGIAVIKLVTSQGRIVRQQQVKIGPDQLEATLDGLGNLLSGLYIISVQTPTQIITRKVLKG